MHKTRALECPSPQLTKKMGFRIVYLTLYKRPRSSVVEHFHGKEKVNGSNPFEGSLFGLREVQIGEKE